MKEMEELVKKLISETYDEFSKDITTFLETYGDRHKFQELDDDCLREKLWNILYYHLNDHMHLPVHLNCLAALRILSRDKTKLDEVLSPEIISIILENAGLLKTLDEQQITYNNVTIESLKLLCNLLYNSTKIRESPLMISSLTHVVKRIENYTNDIPSDAKLFNVRILFLITALNPSTISIVNTELGVDAYLINILSKLLKKVHLLNDDTVIGLEDEDVILSCEVLKVLFNLYSKSDNTLELYSDKLANLVQILRKFLICEHCPRQEELQSNIVNLLTVIPNRYHSRMIILFKYSKDDVLVHKKEFQSMEVSSIIVLLKFLDKRLNATVDLIENISPIVTAFIGICKVNRIARKYVRLQILPPLQDVMKRPEEGTTLRAKLCKLLTSPLTELRDLVAEFLFILCKYKISRMVKYTGYGNAAGMFANKGLLGRHRTEMDACQSCSEESETEEYLKYKEQINPVTGCYEHPKPNPLEGMTEEQKEYEALQLVDWIDKLTRQGVIHPCRVGEDGKPKPIEHVLELQKELPKLQLHRQNSESD